MNWIRRTTKKIFPYPLKEGVVILGRNPERIGNLLGREGDGRCPSCGMRPLTALEYQWVRDGRLKAEEVKAKMIAELKKHGDFTTPTQGARP